MQPWRGTAQDDFSLDRARYRYNWDAPIAFDPFDRALTYFGANVVFATRDRGAHWTVISPDLTRNDKAHEQPAGGPLALDAYHKFLKLGLHAVALSDGDLMAMSSALLGPNDVALGISHTGASRDVTDALARARSHGATTIGITHRASSAQRPIEPSVNAPPLTPWPPLTP